MRLRTANRTGPAPCVWRRGGVATLIVAAAFGLAACGGDDDEPDTAAETTETTEAGGGGETLDITATDFKFDPKDPTVQAGDVAFDLTNDGETLHNIEVEGPSGEAELPQDIGPGEKGSVTVDLNKPGKYRFYCPVGNHEQLGMVGEVTVE